MRSLAGRILREPIVHFMIIGAVIFVGVDVVKAARQPVIRIDSEELSQLAIYWELQMQRPPTKAELQGIVRDRVDEEILSREAQRLGLDKNDMIIRRRLAQKMSFVSEDTVSVPEPTEAQLHALYDANPAAYATPPHLTLRHIYFSDDRPQGNPRAAADQGLVSLRAGRAGITGDPFVLPLDYADVSQQDLDKDYGPAFAAAAMTAPIGAWTGPVRSAYGWHLLRVDARHVSETEPYAAVHTKLREAWIAERRDALNAAALDKLRKRYRIEVTPSKG